MTDERYTRNIPSISEEDQNTLFGKTVTVVGCGGLGGYIIEGLARIGVGKLQLIDCDKFSVSNLNRQLLSTEKNIGLRKVKAAAKRVKQINSSIEVKIIDKALTQRNAVKLLQGSDVVIDALDNIQGRLFCERACESLGIYFIHGAVSGWFAQVSTVAPGSRFMERIYPKETKAAAPSVLSFTLPVAAGIQISEAIKVLLKNGELLEGKLLIADLKNNCFQTIDL